MCFGISESWADTGGVCFERGEIWIAGSCDKKTGLSTDFVVCEICSSCIYK